MTNKTGTFSLEEHVGDTLLLIEEGEVGITTTVEVVLAEVHIEVVVDITAECITIREEDIKAAIRTEEAPLITAVIDTARADKDQVGVEVMAAATTPTVGTQGAMVDSDAKSENKHKRLINSIIII